MLTTYLFGTGRYTCKAQKPLCENCSVKEFCKYTSKYSSEKNFGAISNKIRCKLDGFAMKMFFETQCNGCLFRF